MPNPTLSDVHVNRPLTNVSVKYLQDQGNFVADKVFPNVPVAKQSDLYYLYDRDDLFRDGAELRAPGTESAGGGHKLSTDTYNCKVYSWHEDVADQIRSNYDTVLDADRDATEVVTHKLLIKREKDFVTNFFSSGVWTFDYDGVASGAGTNEVIQWSNYTSSDPIGDVDDAMTSILEQTGFEPNTLVLGYKVFKKLKNHPDIIDRVKYVQKIGPNDTVRITAAALASLFFDGGEGRVFIMKAVESTANEGQTAVAADRNFIGGNKALLCYAAPSPSLNKPSAGYTFNWTGFLNGVNGMRIKKFRLEREASDRIEGEMAYDQKKVSADLGFFWDSIIADD